MLRSFRILLTTTTTIALILSGGGWIRSYHARDEYRWFDRARTIAFGLQSACGQIRYYRNTPLAPNCLIPPRTGGYRRDVATPFDSSPVHTHYTLEIQRYSGPWRPASAPSIPVRWGIAGFAYHSGDALDSHSIQFVTPYWPCVTLATIVLVYQSSSAVRRARRRRQRLCVECNYDLRASTGRCPECGHPIPASNPAANTAPPAAPK